nr:retrovirus-related Pol polyprotein from transposon TNT 1-94 [Tanacetum cinerariifolium]
MIMDMKLEYQIFRAKTFETLSQTYTRYKTLLNELVNDGVTLSKHEINVGFVNSLLEKWLGRYFDAKKALITTPSNSPISTTFFSNNSVQDFQENYDDEADERSLSNGFQPKFTPKLIHSSQHAQSSQREPKPSKPFQSKNKGLVSKTFDWDEEETQVKVLMALADDELSVGKNHARNGEWIDITMKKINILLSIDEDSDWQTYLKYINIDLKYVEEKRLNLLSKYNKIVFELNKYRDDLLALQHPKLEAVTFQIQNTKLTKLNHALQDEHKEERK